MTPEETAAASADAVSNLASYFMLDGRTYAAGAEAGFSGLDFYVCGRGGALGDVDADVVAAAFALFEPSFIRTNWEQGAKVVPPREAAALFIAAGYRWAAGHLAEDGCDWRRLAELLGVVNDAASVGCAPLFAAWRAMPQPDSGGDPRALALHRINITRELRFARHAAALMATGVGVLEALAVRRPEFIPVFGWTAEAPEVTPERQARWDAAEAATNAAVAPACEALEEKERQELAELCAAAMAAVQ